MNLFVKKVIFIDSAVFRCPWKVLKKKKICFAKGFQLNFGEEVDFD